MIFSAKMTLFSVIWLEYWFYMHHIIQKCIKKGKIMKNWKVMSAPKAPRNFILPLNTSYNDIYEKSGLPHQYFFLEGHAPPQNPILEGQAPPISIP